jgi:hypothetical protein
MDSFIASIIWTGLTGSIGFFYSLLPAIGQWRLWPGGLKQRIPDSLRQGDLE